MKPGSFIEIKKIILTPLFSWDKPDEWSKKLNTQGLHFKITSHNNKIDNEYDVIGESEVFVHMQTICF